MPRISWLDKLPKRVREEIESTYIKSNFHSYDELTDKINVILGQNDLEIVMKECTVYHQGKKFKDQLEALKIFREQAQITQRELGDDEGATNDMLITTVQRVAYKLVSNFSAGEDTAIDVAELIKLGKMIADLSKASVQQKQYQQKVRDKLAELKSEAEGNPDAGLSLKTLNIVQKQLYNL